MQKDLLTKILYQESDIQKRCQELGTQITKDYANKNPILICTLKGGFMFFAELLKNIQCDLSIEFIKATSYIGVQSSGNVTLKNFVNFDIQDKDILIVVDIVDTGLTAQKLVQHFQQHQAKSIEIVTLLSKPSRREVNINPKYIGFEIEDCFVIGYGLDYNEKYRNLPCVGIMNLKYLDK